MASEQDNRQLVGAAEQEKISRSILTWLNTYTDKPAAVKFEFLPKDNIGITMSATQSAYIVQSYVDGSYEAQYLFSLIYRCIPSTDNERLEADEILNAFGDWIESATPPDLGDGKSVTEIKKNTVPTLIARYEDGTEDYQLQLTFNYEVEKGE